MKHKNELLTALLCVVLLALFFVIGMRCGLHDAEQLAEERLACYIADHQPVVIEKPVTKTVEQVVRYEYHPLPADYKPILDEDLIDTTDAVLLAKCAWGEYRDTNNRPQVEAVYWCVFNRVMADGFGDTIEEVITAPYQFSGYSPNNPVDKELYDIAVECLVEWKYNVNVCGDDGRPIPEDYLWFSATDGMVNAYRNAYRGGEVIIP